METGNMMPIENYGGNSWFWIVILLFFFWGNNDNKDYARESSMLNQFNERDLFSINQNISDNTYQTAIGLGNVDKDVLLGNANITATMNNLALQNQMAQSTCCCELKTAIHSEGEQTRALITQNRISELEYQLNQANTAVANAVQTQNLLSNLGRYVPYTYGTYSNFYGTTIQ